MPDAPLAARGRGVGLGDGRAGRVGCVAREVAAWGSAADVETPDQTLRRPTRRQTGAPNTCVRRGWAAKLSWGELLAKEQGGAGRSRGARLSLPQLSPYLITAQSSGADLSAKGKWACHEFDRGALPHPWALDVHGAIHPRGCKEEPPQGLLGRAAVPTRS